MVNDYPMDAPEMQARKSKMVLRRTLADVDRRTRAGQEAFRLRDDMAADLGGWDRLTVMQQQLVENAAVLGAMLKDAAAGYLSGEEIDLSVFMALTNAQRRLLADLGLERRAHDVTPDLNAQLVEARRLMGAAE